MFRDPSLDTCIEVLRDNDYIILEGDDAKKNLSELEEIYGEEFIKAVESWLREKGRIVTDLERYDGAKISRNELSCRDCSHEDYCDGNIDEYLRFCNLNGYSACSGIHEEVIRWNGVEKTSLMLT